MKKIFKILLIFILFNNCITDEKTKCYQEKKEKTDKMFAGFNDCNSSLKSYFLVNGSTDKIITDITILSCLVDYSVYLDCKDDSPFAPTIY